MGLVISHLEAIPFLTSLYESVSAIAPVGLTLGIPAQLGFVSKILLALLMIFGRDVYKRQGWNGPDIKEGIR